jgi:hypothetical protein
VPPRTPARAPAAVALVGHKHHRNWFGGETANRCVHSGGSPEATRELANDLAAPEVLGQGKRAHSGGEGGECRRVRAAKPEDCLIGIGYRHSADSGVSKRAGISTSSWLQSWASSIISVRKRAARAVSRLAPRASRRRWSAHIYTREEVERLISDARIPEDCRVLYG